MKPIRIALTKGRLEEKSIEMFEQLGYDCSEIRNKGRRLILPMKNANIEIVLAKAADVITYVENGVCDLGVVGKDTIMEAGGTFYEVADLGFGRCRFALALPAGVNFYEGYHTRCIASKYVNVARSYFEKKNMDVDIVKIEGSVELAPILGLSDAIVYCGNRHYLAGKWLGGSRGNLSGQRTINCEYCQYEAAQSGN